MSTGWNKPVDPTNPPTRSFLRGPPGRDGRDGLDGIGVKGDKGDTGERGPAGDSFYTHVQNAASTVWTVPHNLGKFPVVTVRDSSGDEVEGDIVHVSNVLLTITFSAAFSGTALCN